MKLHNSKGAMSTEQRHKTSVINIFDDVKRTFGYMFLLNYGPLKKFPLNCRETLVSNKPEAIVFDDFITRVISVILGYWDLPCLANLSKTNKMCHIGIPWDNPG